MARTLPTPVWFVIGLVPVLWVLAANPGARIASMHGFFHGSVVMEILARGLPPEHPFLAGEPLLYPWSLHALAALICRATALSPFQALAIVNVLAWGVSLRLAYAIARILDPAHAAPVNAVFMGLCASSLVLPWVLIDFYLYPQGIGLLDPRGVPALEKFTNVNGTPLGVASFLGWLLAQLRYHRAERRRSAWMGVACATLALGLLYPPMLPGVLACAVTVAVAMRWLGRDPARAHLRRAWLGSLSATALGVGLSLPYLRSISAGYSERVRILEWATLARSVPNFLLLSGPTFLFVLAQRARLREHVPVVPRAILLVASATLSAVYLALAQPGSAEYKNLVLAMVAAGLLGGVALGRLRSRPLVYLPFLALLLANPAYEVWRKLGLNASVPPRVREAGGDILCAGDKTLAEAYAWIRENTPADAVLVGDSGLGPLCARRQLFVCTKKRLVQGFNFPLYEGFYVPDRARLERRMRAALGRLGDSQLRRELDIGRPLYALQDLRVGVPVPAPADDWVLAYTTRDQKLRIHRWEPHPSERQAR